jgi:hypothetical protein
MAATSTTAVTGLTQASPSVPLFSNEVADAGVRFRWALQGNDRLYGCMEAKTLGWVTVGFNPRGELDGARLVMGRVVNGKAHAEVHIAKPPQHVHRPAKNGGERVADVSGSQVDGVTRVCFSMPLAAADAEDVSLVAGKSVHLVLAWSHEPDFQHHSAQRGARNTLL